MYDVEYIRQQMRLLRASRGLKQNMVAERMGISPAFYNMLEKGKKIINKPAANGVSTLLGKENQKKN